MFIEKLSDTELIFLATTILKQLTTDENFLTDFNLKAKINRNTNKNRVEIRIGKKIIKLTDFDVVIGYALKTKQEREIKAILGKFLYKNFGEKYLNYYNHYQQYNLQKLVSKKEAMFEQEIEKIVN